MSVNLISTVTVGAGGASSIDFTSIPQTYTDLLLVYSGRAATETSWVFGLKINGVTTNMTMRYLEGSGSGASSASVARISAIEDPVGATANTFSNTSIYIPNYAGNTNKSVSIDSVAETNAAAAYSQLVAGLWSSTAAITSLSIYEISTGNVAQYSTASLYGVNRIPTATLGTTPTVDYLVVAGGGSGGGYVGGGGGGGGFRTATGYSVSSGSAITVTVGAGGAGAADTASNGSNSAFGAITATGGGHGGAGGGSGAYVPSTTGGSGGGGGSSTTSGNTLAGSAGTIGQGNAGGNSSGMSGDYGSGGGGGASAAGETPAGGTGGGDGGAGTVSTMSGNSLYYAGGGGGANGNAYGASIPGAGGIGGGGRGTLHNMADGQVVTPGTPGQPGTGGGGGGGGPVAGQQNYSMSGGSGVVVIRYPDTYNAPTAVTGSPSVRYINGYRVYTWTASGSITF